MRVVAVSVAKVGGDVLVDTNQEARPTVLSDPNKATLAYDKVVAELLRIRCCDFVFVPAA